MGLLNTVTKDRKIYGNCQVYSPDNKLMFRCDLKKANWYLKRNLATTIQEDPLIIKLNFEPNGLGNHNKAYGTHEMKNKCVVCGSEEFLTRHHVVPICYRKYFELEKKSHSFHDVLSVCAHCHEKYESSAFQYKNELAKLYNAPINGELIDNTELFRIRKIVRCLLSSGISKIPNSKVLSMKKELRTYYSWSRVTKKRLQSILNIPVKVYNRTHGEIVVSKIDNVDDFIKSWRNHFIENNNCLYLPINWSIDNE